MSAYRTCKCILQCLAANRDYKIQQGFFKQLLLGETQVRPTPICITDQSGRVNHEDEALRVVEDLVGEVALALQLHLRGLQPGDVEHEAAILQDGSVSIGHREGVDQNVNQGAIFSLESFFVILYGTLKFQFLFDALSALWMKVDLRWYVDL